MKLKEIERTSTFAGAPTSQSQLATGTVAWKYGSLTSWISLRLGGESGVARPLR